MAAVQNIQQKQVKEGRVCLPPKRAVEVWQEELNTHGHIAVTVRKQRI